MSTSSNKFVVCDGSFPLHDVSRNNQIYVQIRAPYPMS